MKNSNIILKELGRVLSNSFYGFQELRITANNRIRDVIRKKNEGISFDKVEEKKETKEKHQSKYTDEKMHKILDEMFKTKKLSQEEFDFIQKVISLSAEGLKLENLYKKEMESYISTEPIYIEFLSKIKGLGIILSCNLIKELGYCEKFANVAKLWAFSGYHTVGGKAPKKVKGQKINWVESLRKLGWLLSDMFVKHRTPFYRDLYDSEKRRQLDLLKRVRCKNCKGKAEEHKLVNGEYKCKKTETIYSPNLLEAPINKMNAELRARRKVAKMFLSNYWDCAKDLSEQPKEPLYVEKKLGHQNITTWKKVLEMMGQ